jgi:hypothetical protein
MARFPTARFLVFVAALFTCSLAGLLTSAPIDAQATPPPSTGGFFPLSQVKAGMKGTAWTVFSGTRPEPMDVEILGVLRGARGPGHDLILAQLHGQKPEYTGVVEGMSGSPVYIGSRLVGALSFRIGQFAKDPIAGITPIEQMMEVRDLPIGGNLREAENDKPRDADTTTASLDKSAFNNIAQPVSDSQFRMMETPLVMSGFSPEAVKLWQQKMAGTGLETVAAGGMGSGSSNTESMEPSTRAAESMLPGSAVSAQLVRGDVEIAATCTVTYVDPKQLLACGHPILQAGTVSLPMTATEVVTTLASPLNAFKIINTGANIGAFTEDRDAAVRGVFGMRAHMIPMHVTFEKPEGSRKLNVEMLDIASLTPQAMAVVLYQSMLQSNENTNTTTYHLTGNIAIEGHGSSPLDVWAAPGEGMPAPMQAALLAGVQFQELYSNSSRQTPVREIDINVQAIPRRLGIEIETARLVTNDSAHAGDKVTVEVTVRPWKQPTRNIRIPITIPARLAAGNVRLLVSDAATLDRTINGVHLPGRQPDLNEVMAVDRRQHAADRIYVSMLVPETQAAVSGQMLASLPLSMANAIEPMRPSQEASLNSESAVVMGDASAGGVLTGFQVITLHIDAGGGLN